MSSSGVQRRGRRTRQRRGEGGAATVLVVAMSGVLMTVAFGVAGVAGLVHSHRLAQSAADLAALAGAEAAVSGGDVCGRAEELAGLNGAELVGCRVTAPWVEVEVTVSPPSVLSVGTDLRAVARAGPSTGPPSTDPP